MLSGAALATAAVLLAFPFHSSFPDKIAKVSVLVMHLACVAILCSYILHHCSVAIQDVAPIAIQLSSCRDCFCQQILLLLRACTD